MKKIAFCGGGSAGHVMPNVALIDALKQSANYSLVYLGTSSIEKDICKQNHIPFCTFSAPKLQRGKIFCNLKIPFKLYKSVREAKTILKKEHPDLLFCKGGYVSIPAAYAAHKIGIPVITHESDLSAGIANKLIARYCKYVLTAFPQTAKQFKNGIYTGTPMRQSLFGQNKWQARQAFGLDMRPTILVFGGGNGSKIINDCLHATISSLCKEFNILHLCGKGNLISSTVYGYKQIEFCKDMGLAYAAADFAVSRCGANAANELTALKIPTLYIPLANKQTRGDQVKNANYFLSLGVCHVLQERLLSPDMFKKCIYTLVSDQNLVKTLYALSPQNTPTVNATKKILNIIQTILNSQQ